MNKKLIINVLKIGIVAALLWWMIRADKLHLSELKVFWTTPMVSVLTVLLWLVGPVMMGTLRWYYLLQGAGVECKFSRALRLQLIGFFFNAAMPGAVGGDIIKAVYIVKDQQEELGRTPAALAVLLDRIVGLMGLFLMGLLAALFNFSTLLQNDVTRNLVFFLFAIVAGVGGFLVLVYSPHGDHRDPILKILELNLPGFTTLKKIYLALRGYRHNPGVIVKTLLLSVVIQLFYMLYMWYLTGIVNGERVELGMLASIFPFGILVTAIPLAPGGLGVGHVAFERLFAIVGIANGANIFNLFALGPLVLNLVGFIPYLSIKSKVKLPESDKVFA